MATVKELLVRIDEEVSQKTAEVVAENDAKIREYARTVYEDVIQKSVAQLKEQVEAQYAKAREYLMQLDQPTVGHPEEAVSNHMQPVQESEPQNTPTVI